MTNREQPPSRWQLLRDVLAFQFKLALDGLRDVLLSPVSIGSAIFGLLTNRENPGKYFYRLLEMGHDSDRWINLFGTYEDEEAPSSDSIVRHAESIVLNELQKGGVVQGLKNHTDTVLDKIQDRHAAKTSSKQSDETSGD